MEHYNIKFNYGSLPSAADYERLCEHIKEVDSRGETEISCKYPIFKYTLNKECLSTELCHDKEEYYVFRSAVRSSEKSRIETKGYYALKIKIDPNWNANEIEEHVHKKILCWLNPNNKEKTEEYVSKQDSLYFLKVASFEESATYQENIFIKNKIREKFESLYFNKRFFENLPLETVPLIEGITSFEQSLVESKENGNKGYYINTPAMTYSVVGDIDLAKLFDGIQKIANNPNSDPWVYSDFWQPAIKEKYLYHIKDNIDTFRKLLRFEGSEFKGLTSDAWYEFAEEIIRTVKRVHNQNMIHGSLRPENIRVKIDFSKISTEEQSQTKSKSNFKKIAQKNFNVKTSPIDENKQQVCEPKFIDAFQFSIVDFDDETNTKKLNDDVFAPSNIYDETKDIYGIGLILFYLGSGKRYRPLDKITAHISKSQIQKELQQVFPNSGSDSETNKYSGISKVIDKCFRTDSHDRYWCCENLLETLDIFRYENEFPFDEKDISSFCVTKDTKALLNRKNSDEFKLLSNAIDDFNGLSYFLHHFPKVIEQIRYINFPGGAFNPSGNFPDKSTFTMLGSYICKQFWERMQNLAKGHLEEAGEREVIINFLTKYMSSLMSSQMGETEYLYVTLTRPEFWSENNLGCSGRFITLNKIMGLNNNIKTIRIFLVDKSGKKPEDYEELQAQRTLSEELLKLDKENPTTSKKNILSRPEITKTSPSDVFDEICSDKEFKTKNLFYTGYVSVDSDKIDDLYSGNKYVALIYSIKRKRYSALSFYSHQEESGPVIHKVRISTLRGNEEFEFIKELASYLSPDSGLKDILELPAKSIHRTRNIC